MGPLDKRGCVYRAAPSGDGIEEAAGYARKTSPNKDLEDLFVSGPTDPPMEGYRDCANFVSTDDAAKTLTRNFTA